MRRSRRAPALALGGALFALSGCGTLIDSFNPLGPNQPRGHVYGGVRWDVRAMQGRSDASVLWALDLPFTLLVDTVLLPGTFVHYLVVRWSR